MSKIINVSNRLPITIVKDDQRYTFKESSGGLKSGLEGVKETIDFLWIGWPGLAVEKSMEKPLEQEIKDKLGYLPVFMSEELADLYYTKYSNGILWPVLHNFIFDCDYQEKYFNAYVKVNELFAKKVLEVLEEDDFVWIHDYHLMLLPKLIREKTKKSVTIAFFLHTNWPSPEIFRIIPQAKQICDSLLYADLVGFHLLKYKSNFTHTCEDLLNTKVHDVIYYKGHMVKIRNLVLGIQPNKIFDTIDSEKTKIDMAKIAEKYKGKKLIIGVDRIDYIKGLDLKFKAYDLFLENNKEAVIFEQIAIPSREDISTYKNYEIRISTACNSINDKHGRVVEYRHESVDFNYLVALYRSADVCIISSLVDGLNLVAFEYIAAQRDRSGVLLLSKFAGCSSVFNTPMQFNPMDC
ncbi:unnamed protein product, partial [Adineta steineri]